MKIHKNTKNKFLAELNEQDMEYYCLDYSSIDIKNSKTKNMLSELILCSELEIKQHFSNLKMNVDIIKKDNDSVYILICLIERKSYRLRCPEVKNIGTAVIVNGANSLIALLQILSSDKARSTFSVISDNKHYLVKITDSVLDKNSLNTLLSEFGEPVNCSDLTFAQLKEHFKEKPFA